MTTIANLWRNYSWLPHLIAWVFFGGMAWAGINQSSEKIATLQVKHESLASDIVNIKTSQARVEQKVDDIKEALNIRHRSD